MSTTLRSDSGPLKRTHDMFKRFGTDIVKLVVGKEEIAMTAHRQLLSDRSDYFKTIFSETWEGPSDAVKFPEDDPTVFSILLGWLYHRNLQFFNNELNHLEMVNVYSLAGKYILPALQDNIIDIINFDTEFEDEVIVKAFNTCQHGCGLQKYLLHCFAYKFCNKQLARPSVLKVKDVLDQADCHLEFLNLMERHVMKGLADPEVLLPHMFYQRKTFSGYKDKKAKVILAVNNII